MMRMINNDGWHDMQSTYPSSINARWKGRRRKKRRRRRPGNLMCNIVLLIHGGYGIGYVQRKVMISIYNGKQSIHCVSLFLLYTSVHSSLRLPPPGRTHPIVTCMFVSIRYVNVPISYNSFQPSKTTHHWIRDWPETLESHTQCGLVHDCIDRRRCLNLSTTRMSWDQEQ